MTNYKSWMGIGLVVVVAGFGVGQALGEEQFSSKSLVDPATGKIYNLTDLARWKMGSLIRGLSPGSIDMSS